MKIRMLLNVGTSETHFPHLKEGEHEVATEDGLRLIERGWAVSLEPPARELQAVPPAASIQAEEPVERADEGQQSVEPAVEPAVETAPTTEAKTNRGKRR